MREIEKQKLAYLGYSNPETEDEVELEILGLELLIKTAEQRIIMLKQGSKVAQMAKEMSDKAVEPKPEDS